MLNIGVLVSGGGTNLQAVIDAIRSGKIVNARIVTVVSSRQGVYAIERAKNHDIPHTVISKKEYSDRCQYDKQIIEHMKLHNVGLVVMAGFLSVVGKGLINEYRNKIINVHPSLIPSFCGAGYYGIKVHKKVLEYGVKVTGATVHFVNEEVDGGPIILQKTVTVEQDDTPEVLQKRVMEEAEWDTLCEAIKLFCENRLKIEGRKVIIT
jgi:phosphoribosylglycinamide formyltransferase-1